MDCASSPQQPNPLTASSPWGSHGMSFPVLSDTLLWVCSQMARNCLQQWGLKLLCLCFKISCSVAQSCLTLQPHGLQHGWRTGYLLLKCAETHVHWVGDAIQSSHPLLTPSPPAFSLSQHQGNLGVLRIKFNQEQCWPVRVRRQHQYLSVLPLVEQFEGGFFTVRQRIPIITEAQLPH